MRNGLNGLLVARAFDGDRVFVGSGEARSVRPLRPREVETVERVVRRLVERLDPDTVLVHDAPALFSALDRLEKLVTGAKALVARHVDTAGAWRRSGYRSAAEYVAKTSGVTESAARALLTTSERLAELPTTAEAVRSGALSARQVDLVAAAAAIAPEHETRLLDVATGPGSIRDLQTECQRARVLADGDRDTTYRRIHAQRYLREWTDAEGAWNLAARGTPDDGTLIRNAIDRLVDRHWRANRNAAHREPREAYAFDALVTLARGVDGDMLRSAPTGGTTLDATGGTADPPDTTATSRRRRPTPVRYLAVLRADVSALARGRVDAGETCEIAGVGPIPARRARDLLGDAVVKLVITKGVDVLNVTHLGRGATAAQRVALMWQSPLCTVTGCNRTRIQIDHREDWTKTHHTRLDELDPLCHHHHDLKTRQGWKLVAGSGPRAIVPPDDPRHPDQAGRAPPDEAVA